jgi:pimeloyl-ACP methyl ester carboxylesterase
MRTTRGHITLAIAVCAALVMLAPATAGAAYRTNTRDKPIVFVHGYDNDGSVPGFDCAAVWGPMIEKLESLGWTGPFKTVGYYEGDYDCSAVINDGRGASPDDYWSPDGHYADGGHNREADIRHLAFHLAWWIYNHYSKQGQTVDIVGHSMGGLIARYAVSRVQAHDLVYPPFLYVEDAVTLGSPHGGAKWFTLFCSSWQCQEMRMGSQFLVDMQNHAWNPQALDGTDWTTIGSDADGVVAADRATGWNSDRTQSQYFGSCHKVWYLASVNVGHSDYRLDTSDALDADVYRTLTDTCGGIGLFDSSRYHPVRQTALALYSGKW